MPCCSVCVQPPPKCQWVVGQGLSTQPRGRGLMACLSIPLTLPACKTRESICWLALCRPNNTLRRLSRKEGKWGHFLLISDQTKLQWFPLKVHHESMILKNGLSVSVLLRIISRRLRHNRAILRWKNWSRLQYEMCSHQLNSRNLSCFKGQLQMSRQKVVSWIFGQILQLWCLQINGGSTS